MPERLPDAAGLETARPRQPASPADLLRVFSRLAMLGFGGVLPIAQRELVERQRWLSTAEFAELLSLSQVLPGPNIINLALMFGDRHFGWRGALAALTGMIGLPLVLVLLLAALYQNLASVPAVQGALRGMGLVAAGLVLATAMKLLPALRRNPLPATVWLPTTLAVAVCVGVLRWPLLAVLLGMGTLSCGLAWQRLRRPAQGPGP